MTERSAPVQLARDMKAFPGATYRWPTVAALVYFSVTMVVAGLEYYSETQKLARDAFTDTFSPFLFSHLLTLPISHVHGEWNYAGAFDEVHWRDAMNSALVPITMNAAAQAVCLFLAVMLFGALARSLSRRSAAGNNDSRERP